MQQHSQKIAQLQSQIKEQFISSKNQKESAPLALRFQSKNSNTTRSKSYKNSCNKLDFSSLNRVIKIDIEKCIAIVEPRVTMKELVKATLAHGFIVPVIPEFKAITVGGAIMGGAAESSSHEWGIFSDVCTAFEIICGNGELIRASPKENQDLFYAIPGSYGSLGALVLAEIKLIPAQEFVHTRYHFFSKPLEAVSFIQQLSSSLKTPDFLDGIVLSKELTVVIEGNKQPRSSLNKKIPRFRTNIISAEWYYQHVQNIAKKTTHSTYDEVMTLPEYLFRYDQGAFWMGSYLLQPTFLRRFIAQVIHKGKSTSFSRKEVEKLHTVKSPNILLRALLYPFMKSKQLWKCLHQEEKWVQDRIIIQDFCLPETKAANFLEEILVNPGIFPLWICPIKGTKEPQIFSPHLLSKESKERHFINFGVYGLPALYEPIEELTVNLERKTKAFGGRKVLYSHSYYTEDEFWEIYCQNTYERLRAKTSAKNVWHEITDKVLSQ